MKFLKLLSSYFSVKRVLDKFTDQIRYYQNIREANTRVPG